MSEHDRALCEYAEKLTQTPAAIEDEDIERLKEYGFDDQAIHDATQVIAYFNYINRVADALAVDTETFVHCWEQSPPESKPVNSGGTHVLQNRRREN